MIAVQDVVDSLHYVSAKLRAFRGLCIKALCKIHVRQTIVSFSKAENSSIIRSMSSGRQTFSTRQYSSTEYHGNSSVGCVASVKGLRSEHGDNFI